MSLTLAEIIERIEDPATPVLWLDPICPEAIWQALPAALAAKGYQVFDLDPGAPFDSLAELFGRLAQLLKSAPLSGLAELRQAFERKRGGGPGCVVLYRQPEALRQAAEGSFEELLDTLAAIDESWHQTDGGALKLVVRD